MSTAATDFILASRSPRRVELLRDAGFRFDAMPADIDELETEMQRRVLDDNWSPQQVAMHLATLKARHIATQHPARVILAADTVVAVGSRLLGKPVDRADAESMIRALSNSVHLVTTGVCVIDATARESAGALVSHITMRQLTEPEIAAHLASDNWQGKAGGYGLQDNDPFITRCEGSPTNVVGLPMELAVPMLGRAGVSRRVVGG
jgi:septum formation protein